MSNESINPPAFPRPGFDQPAGLQDGMTLRDWFAGQAIPAVIRQCAGDMAFGEREGTIEEYFARKAYEIADAMLAESYKRS